MMRSAHIGINIDPYNPGANPPIATLQNVGYVRFPMYIDRYFGGETKAYTFYDPIIKPLIDAGINVILVLLQDTFRGTHPWDGGSYRVYGQDFAPLAQRIVARYPGLFAIEIMNEPDLKGEGHLYIDPADYAAMTYPMITAIRSVGSTCKILSAGLGAGNPHNYLQAVIDAHGKWLFDACSLHPYGNLAESGDPVPFRNWVTGDLRSTLASIPRGIAPIITEIGVPDVNPDDQSLWGTIADYENRILTYCNDNGVICCWFSWSDTMNRGSGLVDTENQPKGSIYRTFYNNLVPKITDGHTVRVGGVNLRRSPDILDDNIIRELPAGEVVHIRKGYAISDGYTWLKIYTTQNEYGWAVKDKIN